ncbi:hypothetical protein I302_101758 [Kwoniella bestiolae CBS 10118]|uniref:Uncharacterized protein n=1 Tax=Kwoniella bestiolae CBS 10118 TaxID=1296100 RepID=A0A1B9GD55_9TREE|nr:hypothetical protein I302_00437 [Kwoniella bestiolae CBS 10118]OCF28946.1 hypothetical protein I302_00437 [Kwoniella bestiolae CBS 10118]
MTCTCPHAETLTSPSTPSTIPTSDAPISAGLTEGKDSTQPEGSGVLYGEVLNIDWTVNKDYSTIPTYGSGKLKVLATCRISQENGADHMTLEMRRTWENPEDPPSYESYATGEILMMVLANGLDNMMDTGSWRVEGH